MDQKHLSTSTIKYLYGDPKHTTITNSKIKILSEQYWLTKIENPNWQYYKLDLIPHKLVKIVNFDTLTQRKIHFNDMVGHILCFDKEDEARKIESFFKEIKKLKNKKLVEKQMELF